MLRIIVFCGLFGVFSVDETARLSRLLPSWEPPGGICFELGFSRVPETYPVEELSSVEGLYRR